MTGVVLRVDGRPAAGASINAAAIFRSPPLRKSTVTDEEGRFRIDLPSLSGSKRYQLAVRWQRQGVDLTRALDENGKSVSIAGQLLPPLVVRLRPAGQLRGKLLRAEDDGPIAAAKLFLDTGEVLTTDEEGAFEATGLPMDDHSLIPAAPGRVRQYVLFDTTFRPEAELDIRLPRGAVIKGRITDEQGQPVAGAYLTRSSSGTALTLNGWDEMANPDGTFEYGGLSTKRLFYGLNVMAPGFTEQTLSSEVDDAGDVIERIVQLKRKQRDKSDVEADHNSSKQTTSTEAPRTVELPRRTITGSVADADGRKVARAKVRWAAFMWDPSVDSVKTDAEGNFRLDGVPGAAGALLVVADGYAPEFAVLPEGSRQLDVVLSPGTTVRGVVRGTSGKPVAGVRITMVTQCMETGYCNPIWLDERSTRTGEQGEFKIAAVPEAGITFDFLKDGYSDLRSTPLKTGGEPNEIKLQTGGAVRGRVVDQAGDPVRDFKIRVMIPRTRYSNEKMGGYYAGFDWYGVRFTRDDGVFVLSDVGAGAWLRLIVSAPGIGRAILDRVQAEPLDALSPAGDLTIELEPYVPLAVHVQQESSGEPLAGALVTLLEDEPDFSGGFSWSYHDLWAERRRSDTQGVARFAEPVCQDGTIIVRASGFARQRVAWDDGAQEVSVSLVPEAILHGEVRMDGRRLAEGYARLTSEARDHLTVDLAATEGRFEFDQLLSGEYTLEITGKGGGALYSDRVTLEGGKARAATVSISGENNAAEPSK